MKRGPAHTTPCAHAGKRVAWAAAGCPACDPEATMAKGKSGGYPNPKGHTGPRTQFPQAKRPPSAVVPRVVARTKASPKGR
jgi:hypothetical protein